MGWEDMAHQSSLPNKFRLSFSTGALKHPPDGFIPGMKPPRSLVIMGWEDMAHRNAFLPEFSLHFRTGAMKHPPDGFIPVLRDRQFLDGF